ncbi:hypothetical protein HAX54_022342 [Datura stramonium]|uniref:Uncharacterized protein n=1 Tax=Datura stramonium TaxID=4076 RepID=A0ABS8S478_DATST|nr:hypothetical protein [Datura stramonium]
MSERSVYIEVFIRDVLRALSRVRLVFEELFNDDDRTDDEQARVDSDLESNVDEGEDLEMGDAAYAPTNNEDQIVIHLELKRASIAKLDSKGTSVIAKGRLASCNTSTTSSYVTRRESNAASCMMRTGIAVIGHVMQTPIVRLKACKVESQSE